MVVFIFSVVIYIIFLFGLPTQNFMLDITKSYIVKQLYFSIKISNVTHIIKSVNS